MKKIFKILLIAVVLTMLFATASSAQEGDSVAKSDEKFDFLGYVEGTVVPAAVAVVSSAALLYIACLPLIRSVKGVVKLISGSKENFDEATKKVNDSEEQTKKHDKEIAALRTEVALLNKKLDNVEKIERIGFGGMSELVKSGAARKIGKVGNDERKA